MMNGRESKLQIGPPVWPDSAVLKLIRPKLIWT